MEEMERLNRAFGIGIILLSPFSNDTRELFQARKKELDYYTIDKLSRINPDFKNFIVKTTKVLNSQNDVVEDVKNGLQKFCDKGFTSEDEIAYYCDETNIPMQHIHITDYQRPFILIGTTSLLTSSQEMGTNASRCLSSFCIYALYRLSPAHLQNVRHQFQSTD